MSRIVTTAVVLKRALGGVKGFDEFKLIKDYECPEFGDEDVVVKIEACALSKYDMKILDDLKILSDNPLPVGREISGIVSQVGKSVSRFRVNDEIAGIIPLDVSCAGCGNICVLSQHDIVKKPASVCHVDAAAIIGDAVKAYTALYYLAKISTGETILVCNGASSLGLTVIQLAQHIGAKVIATASSEEELHFLRAQQPPIAQVIDMRFKKHSLISTCLEETGGLGVDCIIDNGVEMSNSLEDNCNEDLMKFDDSSSNNNSIPRKHDLISSLAVAGRWITPQNDLQLDPPDSKLLFLKCASICFLFAESWTISRDILEDIMRKLSNGTLRPTVHHSVQLDDCTQALKQLDENQIGRVVMKTS